MSSNTVGQILKVLIKGKGLRQNYIAKRIGVSPSALSQKLSTDTDIITTIKICQILGISVKEVETRYFGKKKDTDCSAKNSSVSQTTKLHK